MTRSGALDQPITIERATAGQSASGAPTETWATLITAWARVSYPGAREQYESGQVQGQIDALFRIRWRGDYTPATKDRVVFDSVNYDIVSVVPVGRNEAWDILARARNV